MAKTLITAAFLSAVIRKDMKEVYACALEHEGKEDQAAEVRTSSRMTKALMDRTSTFVESDEEPIKREDADVSKTNEADPTDIDYADKDAEKSLDEKVAHAADDFKAVEKAIKKGKGKKALKLIKAMEDGGARGSVLKNLKKQAKAL